MTKFGHPEGYNNLMGNEVFFEGKKYISARRASQITGYNSDYIGQLCRKGLLECRLVGRSWFVSEISLGQHKVDASKTRRGRIPIYQDRILSKFHGIDLRKIRKQKRVFSVPTKTTLLSEIDTTSAPPPSVPTQAVQRRAGGRFSFRSEEHKAFLRPLGEVVPHMHFGKKVAALSLAIVVLLLSVPFLLHLGVGRDFSLIKQAETQIQSLASVPISLNEAKESIAFGGDVFESLKVKISEFALQGYSSIARLPGALFGALRGMKQLVFGTRPSDEQFEFPGSREGPRGGITVVPSTGDRDSDEKLKQYIRDSFSGETEVRPDETGESGVIKPIFKEKDDQDYLYVLVPIKE